MGIPTGGRGGRLPSPVGAPDRRRRNHHPRPSPRPPLISGSRAPAKLAALTDPARASTGGKEVDTTRPEGGAGAGINTPGAGEGVVVARAASNGVVRMVAGLWGRGFWRHGWGGQRWVCGEGVLR